MATARSIDMKQFRTYLPEIDTISSEALRESIVKIWDTVWRNSEFAALDDVPVTVDLPYSQLKHCQGVVRGALALASVWEPIHGVKYDRDVLIGAALLLDISKAVELRPNGEGGAVYSDLGKAVPHPGYVVHLALEAKLPYQIINIVATHSASSAKAPTSLEGRLLHWIDQADVAVFGGERWQRQVYHLPAARTIRG